MNTIYQIIRNTQGQSGGYDEIKLFYKEEEIISCHRTKEGANSYMETLLLDEHSDKIRIREDSDMSFTLKFYPLFEIIEIELQP